MRQQTSRQFELEHKREAEENVSTYGQETQLVDLCQLTRDSSRLFRSGLITPRQTLEFAFTEPREQLGNVSDRSRSTPECDCVLRFLREGKDEIVEISECRRRRVSPSTVRELDDVTFESVWIYVRVERKRV